MSNFYQDDGEPCTGQKLCLATTSYDNPDASYTYAIQNSRELLHANGIQTAYYLLQGNCHVDDARNRIAQEFMASDCTELVFLDADVSWKPADLLRLAGHDKDLVGGVYPYRREDKGEDMPVRMLPGARVDADGLIEVEGLPTGFLKISRKAIKLVSELSASYVDKDGRTMYLLFERTLADGVRWGGDLAFCNKWRSLGGRLSADYEMVLGHATKTVLRSSLGATVRKREQTTLRYICGKIKDGTYTLKDLTEARDYVGNHYGALEEFLAAAVKLAAQADGPILETGSGLSTILMAAATDQTVYCLEHHGLYVAQLRQMVAESGVSNIGLCVCPIVDGWYDVSDKTLPEHFALGVNDGPPRGLGSRMGYLTRYGERTDTILCDDADAPAYRELFEAWAAEHGRQTVFVEPRTLIVSKEAWQQPAILLPAA